MAVDGMARCRPANCRRGIYGLLLLLAACSGHGSINGPAPAFDIDQDISQLRAQYESATSIDAYYKAGPETSERRDAFVVGRLTLYNLEYIKFIQQFALDTAQLESAFDITKLGVDLSTTLVGGAATKAILGAISAGLTGSRISIEKNFFEQKTTQALVTQMNAQRKAALVAIVAGLKQGVDQYPLASAIVDLNAYYEAGTIQGALQGIQTDAGIKEAQADKAIDQYRNSSYGADTYSIRIEDWIWPGVKSFDADGNAVDASGKIVTANQANVKALREWLDSNGLPGLAIGAFLDNKALTSQRVSAVAALQIP